MENKLEFKLVDGVYSSEDAGRVLYELIGSKINFHNMEKFGIAERSNESTLRHQERIAALRLSQNALQDVIQQANKAGKRLKIDGVIKIKMVK